MADGVLVNHDRTELQNNSITSPIKDLSLYNNVCIRENQNSRSREIKGRTNPLSSIERSERVVTPRASGKRVLTNWRVQKESQVRTQNK